MDISSDPSALAPVVLIPQIEQIWPANRSILRRTGAEKSSRWIATLESLAVPAPTINEMIERC
jgi:hypothetical protein